MGLVHDRPTNSLRRKHVHNVDRVVAAAAVRWG